MPTRRRVSATKSRPRSTRRRKSAASANGTPATRRRRDPFAREWVNVTTEARRLGIDWRTLRRTLVDEPFVRVLADRWYVRHTEFVAWWERQRPKPAPRRPSRGAQ